jgi:hypothetical protein
MVAAELCTFVEGRIDEICGELLFSIATPGVGPLPAFVRNPMEVGDLSELHLPPIPEMRVSYVQREVEMAYTIARNAEMPFRT